MGAPNPRDVQERLLRWFDASKRDLPWRRTRDPYRILVAEYLLQRTRVVSGTPFYERFLERFPNLRALARASEDDVLRAWEGLGFYRRAKNLHAAARTIVECHGGRIPSTAAVLEALPGMGPYTAGAVASIAFGERVSAVDGNVTRVLARLYRIDGDVTRGKVRKRLQATAESLVPASRPGAFNQALMELGATVCAPSSPACPRCALEELCLARHAGVQSSLPRRIRRREPRTVSVAFGLIKSPGRILLVRRPATGLLAGLWSLPGGEIPDRVDVREELRELIREQTGLRIRVGEETARVAHTFSHRKWSGAIYGCTTSRTEAPKATARWTSLDEIHRFPLVAFHRKALESLRSRPALETFNSSE